MGLRKVVFPSRNAFFYSAEGDPLFRAGIGAFGVVHQRRGVVPVFVHDHKSLRFDGPDAFGRHVGLIVGILLFERIDFVRFERCARVAFHAADTLAGRQVAGETIAQQVGADDLIVYLDHKCLR